MAFSLSSWFKGKPGDVEQDPNQGGTTQGKDAPRKPSVPPPAAAPGATLAPPPAVRTVLPSNTPPPPAPVSLRTPGAPTIPAARPPVTRSLPVRPPARKVSFPVPSNAGSQAPAPASVPASSFAPAAPVPEAPDTTVSLEIGDFIDRIPPGFLNSDLYDRNRVVEFRASELYSDLSKGRASVPASTIYAKCPDIFARPISDTEDVEIQLPLQRLVEQLSAAFTTRADQVSEESVGEIETPFLQVAMEDNARLPTAAGTNAGAIRPPVNLPIPSSAEAAEGLPQRPAHRTGQISTISARPAVEPPTGPTFAPPSAPPINPGKRPPSTVRASVAGGKIRLSGPATVNRMAPIPGPVVPPPARPLGESPSASQRIEVPRPPVTPSAFSPSHQVAKKTARIQIPPISLKPAGSSPTSLRPPGAMPPPPSLPVQPSPVSIRPNTGEVPTVNFRSSPPPSPAVNLPPPSFAPSPRPSFPPPSFPAVPPPSGGAPSAVPGISVPPPAPAPVDGRRITLGLSAVLRGQPASALAVEPESVPDDVRVSLPFALIERQLSTGRVSLPRQTFEEALPEAYRGVLAEDGDISEVQIPLQEVFQNLPGNALTMRQDQVVEEVGNEYPTPFSQKAEEDAQRFGVPVATVAAPAPVQEPAEEESFGSLFEEAPPAEGPEAVAPVEEAPALEETLADEPAQVEEPAEEEDHDLPAVVEQVPEEPEAKTEEFPFVPSVVEEPASEPEPEPETTAPEQPEMANVVDVHPAEAAVEPPAPVDPPPVAEALAVLESTAPAVAEQETVNEKAPAPAIAPLPEPVPLSETKPAEIEMPAKAEAPAYQPSTRAQATAAPDTTLQTLLMTEDDLDAKAVVRHVCQLPGITGCAVMFADGLRLAGNFPEGDAEGFSAMAPPFFKRTGNFAIEAELGALQAITLYTDKGLLSFFMHGEICLSVRHTGRGFLPGVREKLEIVTRELARMYGTDKSAASQSGN